MTNSDNRTNETCVIAKLMPQALAELRAEKICLIEDIFKVLKTCRGFGIPGVEVVTTEPSKLFDMLWDQSISDLQVMLDAYSAIMGTKFRELAGFKENEITTGFMDRSDDDIRKLFM